MPARLDVPDVRHFLLGEHIVKALAHIEQAVVFAAREPQELQFAGGLGRILEQFAGRLGVRSRREAADPGERVEMSQAEIERLAAPHRKARQGAVLAVGLH